MRTAFCLRELAAVIVAAGVAGTLLLGMAPEPPGPPARTWENLRHIAQAAEKGEVLTGLLYLAPDAEDLHAHLNTYEAPFNQLGEKDLCPGAGMLEKINAALR